VTKQRCHVAGKVGQYSVCQEKQGLKHALPLSLRRDLRCYQPGPKGFDCKYDRTCPGCDRCRGEPM